MNRIARCLPAMALAAFVLCTRRDLLAAPAAYDPLELASGARPQRIELTVSGEKRQVPLLVYLPARREPAPVVLFSHGLGGSREGNAFMGEHWAARGYVSVFMQHPGSDTSVWQDLPPAERMRALRSAGSVKNFLLRVEDVHATLDQLDRWNTDATAPLKGRLDLAHTGMSGHSFGAITTQASAGEVFVLGKSGRDARIKAAIIFSPSVPRRGDAKKAFGSVDIPWMMMTGTNDTALIGNTDAASRLEVFPALPPGGKYELVLDRAEHSAFTDRALPGDREPRNANHHRAILALSAAFWDACLRGDQAARGWLDGPGPRSVLQDADRWQRK